MRVIDAEHLSFALKTPWRDGTTHLVLSPSELIEKLAALIPPPRLNLVRYHGVFAPNAADRAQIVAGPEADPEGRVEGAEPVPAGRPPRRPCRLSWAQLLARVFQMAVTVCPACGGHLQETGRQTGLHHRRADGGGLDPALPGGCGPGGSSTADRPGPSAAAARVCLRRRLAPCRVLVVVEKGIGVPGGPLEGRLAVGRGGVRGALRPEFQVGTPRRTWMVRLGGQGPA